jgi:hypothetical protein
MSSYRFTYDVSSNQILCLGYQLYKFMFSMYSQPLTIFLNRNNSSLPSDVQSNYAISSK